MKRFASLVCRVGSVQLPDFSGVRILIMPYKLEDPEGTLPDFLAHWRPTVKALGALATTTKGTAYLTIDEAIVEAGETHRRPGMHVDGVGPDGISGAIWGGGAIWSSSPSPKPPKPKKGPKQRYGMGGMLLASSHLGCRAWDQDFIGLPGPDGDCSHLSGQCDPDREILMRAGEAYWCGHLGVHEAIPMKERTARQLIRISMPSKFPWYEGCTPNPLGILPDGPIAPRREHQLAYRT
jgi:hypothetical protein